MRWIVGVGPLGQRRVRIAVPGVFTVWLRPTATANCNDESVNNVAISLVKQYVRNSCNECVRRHEPQIRPERTHRVQEVFDSAPNGWPVAKGSALAGAAAAGAGACDADR
jgi:hypothetical protein